MSTKCTLVHGKTFSLSEEGFDPAHNVWLELDGCAFEATPQGVRMEIPLAIWEVIRKHTPARFDLASLTDAQLQAEAEKRVEATRADYRAALSEQRAARQTPAKKRRHTSMLSLLYRDALLTREEHLTTILEQLRAARSDQRKLQRQIARLSARPKA